MFSNWYKLGLAFLILLLIPIIQSCYKFCRWILHLRAVNKAVNQLPGVKPHWLKGNMFDHPMVFNEKYLAYLQDYTDKFPRCYKYFMTFLCPRVVVNHPDTLKMILKTSEPKAGIYMGSGSYTLMKSWLGDGLLMSSGRKWYRNRKLLTPGFHFDILKPYVNIYNGAVGAMIQIWDLACVNGSSVDIYAPVSRCTLDVMLQCAFSYENDVQCQENEYVKAIHEISQMVMDRWLNPLFYNDLIYYYLSSQGRREKKLVEYVHSVRENIIQRRKQVLKENQKREEKKYVDFLDILLLAKDDHGNGLTDQEIRDEVDTFLFEGHDTTASAISWILYALAKHPEIQQQCREEVNNVISDPSAPFIAWDALSKIPYLTQCIKEGLRFYSPVPFPSRELTVPLELDGHTLLPGTFVDINIYGVHHNAQVWGKDHNEFKPERFDPDKIEKMDSHAFLPFSAGPRNCIGQNFAMNEMKVAVGRILHHFELSVDDSHKVERVPSLVIRAQHGIKLFLKPLN